MPDIENEENLDVDAHNEFVSRVIQEMLRTARYDSANVFVIITSLMAGAALFTTGGKKEGTSFILETFAGEAKFRIMEMEL